MGLGSGVRVRIRFRARVRVRARAACCAAACAALLFLRPFFLSGFSAASTPPGMPPPKSVGCGSVASVYLAGGDRQREGGLG